MSDDAIAIVCLASIYLGALTAFAFIVATKWGGIQYLQTYGSRIFGRFKAVAQCEFCLMFWIGFFLTLPFIFILSPVFIACLPAVAVFAKALYEGSKSKIGNP
jgi:hypothetical protein